MSESKAIPASELDLETLQNFARRGLMTQKAVDQVIRTQAEAIARKNSNGRGRKASSPKFPRNRIRSYALRVMAVIAELTPQQRARVLEQASKLNQV